MFRDEIPARRLTAWLFAAVLPCAIQVTAGTSWLTVLLSASACLLCVWLRWCWGRTPDSKVYWLAMLGLLSLVLASAIQAASECWQGGGNGAVALILLALALWSSQKGASAACRAGAVLMWFFIILYTLLFWESAAMVELEWLTPSLSGISELGSIILLTPAAAAIYLGRRQGGFQSRLAWIGIACVIAAIVTTGVLSPAVANVQENAFYEMTRSLVSQGKARRYEAILSAGVAMGWYSLMSLYLSVCADAAKHLNPAWGRKGAMLAITIALGVIWLGFEMPEGILLLIAGVLWVFTPVLSAINDIRKNVEKNEKSA